jgi:hypothetical protein
MSPSPSPTAQFSASGKQKQTGSCRESKPFWETIPLKESQTFIPTGANSARGLSWTIIAEVVAGSVALLISVIIAGRCAWKGCGRKGGCQSERLEQFPEPESLTVVEMNLLEWDTMAIGKRRE